MLIKAQQIFKAPGFSQDSCFAIAELSDGTYAMAVSGKRTKSDQSTLDYASKTVLPTGISVEDSDGWQGIYPDFIDAYGFVEEIKGMKNVRIGPIGTRVCAEKKVLTHCLVNRLSMKSIAVFAGSDFKFLSYQQASGGSINYLFPCESCKTAYCEYIELKMAGVDGYPRPGRTGVGADLPDINDMLDGR